MTEINTDRTGGLMEMVETIAKELREQEDYGDAWNDMNGKFPELHPVVYRLLGEGYAPKEVQELVFQWPHVAVGDETQIAYTRSPEHMQADRQTRTGIGKYVARHWPHLPDHMRRDFVASFVPAEYAIWDTKELIICGVELGPTSCMNSASGSIPFSRPYDFPKLERWFLGDKTQVVPWEKHPYIAYAPQHGWGLAVRLDIGKPDDVRARAVVHIPSRIFVRSFKKSAGYSYSDEKLEFWLKEQGYEHKPAWMDGLKLGKFAHPTRSCPIIVPYIDGGTDRASDMGDHLVISRHGDYGCNNTDGTCDGWEDDEDEQGDYLGDCDRCGDSVYENDDDRIAVGRSGDEIACGRRIDYYVHDDNVVEVNGEYYDSDNLPGFIIYLDSGEYAHRDDCVEIEGNWYHEGDDAVVCCADGEYRLRENCWEDLHSLDWYPDDVASVEWDGKGPYHPESVAELQAEADEAAGQQELEFETDKEMENEQE